MVTIKDTERAWKDVDFLSSDSSQEEFYQAVKKILNEGNYAYLMRWHEDQVEKIIDLKNQFREE